MPEKKAKKQSKAEKYLTALEYQVGGLQCGASFFKSMEEVKLFIAVDAEFDLSESRKFAKWVLDMTEEK